MANVIATIGQALGLPEMGISERLSNSTTQNAPSYTGPGVFGSGGYVHSPVPGGASAYPVNEGIYSSGPYQGQIASNIQGVNTGPVQGPAQPPPTTQNNNNNNNNGGGGGRVISEGDALKMGLDINHLPGGYTRADAGGPSQEQINGQIDSIYNEYTPYLNQAETNVRDQYGRTQQDMLGQNNVAMGDINLNHQTGLNTLNQNSLEANNSKENADSAARRLYGQLQMGNRQRFGGASSAGQAASEIQGVEQQRQMGQNSQQLNTFQHQQALAGQQQEAAFSQAKVKQNQIYQQSLNQATSDFQNKLLDITNNRTMIATAKQSAKLQALQDLRNQVFAVNQQNTQFQQTLEAQKAASQLAIQQYNQTSGATAQGAQGNYNSYNQNLNMTPTAQNTVGPSNAQQTQGPMIGSITKPKDDPLAGYINPVIRNNYSNPFAN